MLWCAAPSQASHLAIGRAAAAMFTFPDWQVSSVVREAVDQGEMRASVLEGTRRARMQNPFVPGQLANLERGRAMSKRDVVPVQVEETMQEAAAREVERGQQPTIRVALGRRGKAAAQPRGGEGPATRASGAGDMDAARDRETRGNAKAAEDARKKRAATEAAAARNSGDARPKAKAKAAPAEQASQSSTAPGNASQPGGGVEDEEPE